jgi:hypothetical protein
MTPTTRARIDPDNVCLASDVTAWPMIGYEPRWTSRVCRVPLSPDRAQAATVKKARSSGKMDRKP